MEAAVEVRRGGKMKVDLPDAQSWAQIASQLREHGGAALRVAPAQLPQPLQSVEVVFSGPDGVFARASGQAVQMSPDGQVYMVFEDAPGLAGTAFGATEPDVSEDDRPLWVRYPELGKAEKIRLARQGNNEARRLIMKDKDKTLHLHLLQNPGLSGSEVAGLIRGGGAAGGFLQRVATQRSDLLGNAQVVEAIVTNPATPVPLAIQLVAKLPLETARRIAKAGNLRMPIIKAARKRVIR